MLQKKFNLSHKFLGVNGYFWLITGVFLVFSLLYSLLSIYRHEHFQSQAIDFSIYDQALWLYSRFEKPFITIYQLVDLADRFRPIMFPVSILYWFSDNERVLLIFQSIILSAAVFPIWLLAKNLTSPLLAVIIAFLYVDFVGVQAAAVYDFHEMTILPFFLASLFYFLYKRHWIHYFIVLIICLSVREHVGFFLSTLGVFIWITQKSAKVALATFFVSISWSILAIKIIMPMFGQVHYESFLREGQSLELAILEYLKNPSLVLTNLFFPAEKSQTLLWSFLSFGFLPLMYVALLMTILFHFASRFLDLMHPIRWTLYYHYSIELAVIMAVSTAYALNKILWKLRQWRLGLTFLCIYLLGTHILVNFAIDSPLKNLLKASFYTNEPWMDETRLIISKIPKESTVATQNNLLPHLSHRKEIYLLPKTGGAEYVVFDLHAGQNDWNFYTGNIDIAKSQLKQLVVNGQYSPVVSSGNVYLLRKKH